jgi:hypothetical protein
LSTCLADEKTCDGISVVERDHVLAWKAAVKSMADGTLSLPATASLTALHNLVSETIPSPYMDDSRKRFFCPADALHGLKQGIFKDDSDIANFVLPAITPVPGVAGLSVEDSVVNCTM